MIPRTAPGLEPADAAPDPGDPRCQTAKQQPFRLTRSSSTAACRSASIACASFRSASTSCLQSEQIDKLRTCIRLCIDCTDLCVGCADVVGRRSPHGMKACAPCADACDACAAECEKFLDMDEIMRKCAEACRRCADTCRQVAAAA